MSPMARRLQLRSAACKAPASDSADWPNINDDGWPIARMDARMGALINSAASPDGRGPRPPRRSFHAALQHPPHPPPSLLSLPPLCSSRSANRTPRLLAVATRLLSWTTAPTGFDLGMQMSGLSPGVLRRALQGVSTSSSTAPYASVPEPTS